MQGQRARLSVLQMLLGRSILQVHLCPHPGQRLQLPILHSSVREFPDSKNPRTSASLKTLKVSPVTASLLRNPSTLCPVCLHCAQDRTCLTRELALLLTHRAIGSSLLN